MKTDMPPLLSLHLSDRDGCLLCYRCGAIGSRPHPDPESIWTAFVAAHSGCLPITVQVSDLGGVSIEESELMLKARLAHAIDLAMRERIGLASWLRSLAWSVCVHGTYSVGVIFSDPDAGKVFGFV